MLKPLQAFEARALLAQDTVIVFAPCRRAAHRRAARQMNVPFKKVISCRRAAQLDAFADAPAPPAGTVLYTTRVKCLGCCKPLAADADPSSPYCDARCHERRLIRDAVMAAFETQTVNRLTRDLKQQWPNIEVTSGRAHAGVDHKGHQLTSASLSFSFPGSRGQASWHTRG